MKALVKLILSLALVFISIFIVMKLTGIITIDKVENWLLIAKNAGVLTLILIVIVILLSDLLLSIPTLATVTLSGYFLGHTYGAIASLIGLMLVGMLGYVVSYYHGEKIEKRILPTSEQRLDARQNFKKHGYVMILFSRAIPMLPEISACMAGMTNMPFSRFIGAWLLSITPYILICTYAGSVSSLDNPAPAIYSAISVNVLLWLAWYYHRVKTKCS
ncbi:VTT domain-containing protein [uncultured Paraglaciecola sp.]|uniref:TVP38/TMEM64 family protein n=1 Tax=uncultured Paraglaciecola sp. TaxID=1765024 RepID=UPI002598FB80|nr:VTT domain-containing protein [uncultured Paraglaciecola sp.]